MHARADMLCTCYIIIIINIHLRNYIMFMYSARLVVAIIWLYQYNHTCLNTMCHVLACDTNTLYSCGSLFSISFKRQNIHIGSLMFRVVPCIEHEHVYEKMYRCCCSSMEYPTSFNFHLLILQIDKEKYGFPKTHTRKTNLVIIASFEKLAVKLLVQRKIVRKSI